MKKIFCVFGAFSVWANLAWALAPGPEFETEVQKILAAQKTSAAAIAISYKDKVIYTKGIGFLDANQSVPANESTLFHAASVSKMFTALAIHHLIEEEELSLDTPLYKVLPWFSLQADPALWQSITIGQVLNHTSGMSREMGCVFTDQMGLWLPGLSLADCSRGQEMIFTPGSRLKYSNLGYILLGQVIEKISGDRYADFVKENVLDPLQMRSAKFVLNERDMARLAKPYGFVNPYTGKREEWPRVADTYFHAPAWGLTSDARSIGKILPMIYSLISGTSNPVLGREYSRTILKNFLIDPASPSGYAQGFLISVNAATGVKRFGHTGNFPGYSASIYVDEKSHIGVAVLTNAVERGAATAISNLAFTTAEQALGLPVTKAAPEIAVDDSNLDMRPGADPLDGKYWGWPRFVNISTANGKVSLTQDGRTQVLVPVPNTMLTFRQSTEGGFSGHLGERIEFRPSFDGSGTSALVYSNSYLYLKAH